MKSTVEVSIVLKVSSRTHFEVVNKMLNVLVLFTCFSLSMVVLYIDLSKKLFLVRLHYVSSRCLVYIAYPLCYLAAILHSVLDLLLYYIHENTH